MAKAQRYTIDQIEADRKKLRSLPVKTAGETWGKGTEFLGKDIRKAVRQGYTLRDIRDVLADAGLSVPLTRLKALVEEAPVEGPATATEGPKTGNTPPVGGGETGEHEGEI